MSSSLYWLNQTGEWLTFDFTSQNIQLSDNTEYWLRFSASYATGFGNIEQAYQNTNVYANGQFDRTGTSPGTNLGDLTFEATYSGIVDNAYYLAQGYIRTRAMDIGQTPTDPGEWSFSDVVPTYTALSMEQERKKRDLQLAMAGQAFGAMSTMMQNLYVATGSKNKAMFSAMKAFAIAETVVQTDRAAQGAYAALSSISYVGPALGVAAAAAAIAAGMARVAQIRAMEPGGSGAMSAGSSAGAGYSPSAPSAYSMPERISQDSRPVQNVNVYIQNGHGTAEYWGKLVEENIVPALNSSAERKVFINVG